jgi:hypothetical protein
LDIFRMFPLGDEQAGINVLQVIKLNPGQTDPLEGRGELIADIFYSISAWRLL